MHGSIAADAATASISEFHTPAALHVASPNSPAFFECRSMKIYQVVRRGSQWHVHIPGAGRAVHGSEDKSRIVDWARDEARRIAGEVHVRDRGGRVEAIYSYVDGVESRRELKS